MGKLIIKDNDESKEFEIKDGDSIIPACEEAGIPFACTEGVCGTCVVEVLDGEENLSEYTQEEEDFLGDQQQERLACQCKLNGGCTVITF